MKAVVAEARNLTKRYKDVLALDDVSITLSEGRIYGLLGRNGAGKTTLMSVLTAQAFATSGQALVFGEEAYENESVLARVCFIRESQKYPDDFKPVHAFRAARLAFGNWRSASSMTSGCLSGGRSRNCHAGNCRPSG